jgi:hypothetical protein
MFDTRRGGEFGYRSFVYVNVTPSPDVSGLSPSILALRPMLARP